MLTNVAVDDISVRRAGIQRLLRRIRPSTRGAARAVPVHFVRQDIAGPAIWAAADQKTVGPHREWLLRTSVRSIWAQYSEKWLQLSQTAWGLSEFALHLYIVGGANADQRREVLA